MTYEIYQTSHRLGNGSAITYWYYDIIGDDGIEVNTRAHFTSYAAAKISAEAEVFRLWLSDFGQRKAA